MTQKANRATLLVVGLATLLVLQRVMVPERLIDQRGPSALLDAWFAIGLLVLMLALAAGSGRKLLGIIEVSGLVRLEGMIFSLALGLGIVSGGVLVIGLLGLLEIVPILLWLLIVGIWSRKEWARIVGALPDQFSSGIRRLRELTNGKRALLAILGLIWMLAFLQALAPPTDPDGLIYHLAAPKAFLASGRISPMPEFVYANAPFSVQMLFTVGMALGTDIYAQLIHLTFATLLVLATYTMGRRLINSDTGWIAASIVVGMPIMPIWSSLAYVDMAWALYEFLAVYALVVWISAGQRRWLLLAGVLAGLALGTKYLGAGIVASLGLWLLWHQRRRALREIIIDGAVLGGTALLVASPWYIKNWIWLGDPVYPILSSEVFSGGYENFEILDYFLLPLRLFTKRELFVGVYGSIEFPSILLLLAILYPLARRSQSFDGLAGMTLLRYLFWAAFTHVRFRYLLPALPGLSLMAAGVIMSLYHRTSIDRLSRVITWSILGGLLVVTLVYSALFALSTEPYRVVTGLESKAEFLRRQVSDYRAKEFIQSELPADARVLMPWDGRGYYCDNRCVPDWTRTKWVQLVEKRPSPDTLASTLKSMGVSHLLLSAEDVDYSVINNITGTDGEALDYFLHEFRPACTERIYSDDWTELFEITCE